MTANDDLWALRDSWELAMDAQQVSRHTMRAYLTASRQLLEWADARGEVLDLADPATVRGWLAAHRGVWQAGTATVKLGAARSFARFLAAEEDIGIDGTLAVPWPKKDTKIPPALSAEQVRAMIEACPSRTFPGVRDAAIISLLYDTLMRSEEALALRCRTGSDPGDIDLRARTVHIRMGKGRKERYAAFGPETARRVDRYLRYRARQPNASQEALWLATGRAGLTPNGLYAAVKRRGETVGIRAFPHMARAGGAIMWRRRGGSTEGLMTIGGWQSLTMLRHYTAAADTELALEEAHRLHDRGAVNGRPGSAGSRAAGPGRRSYPAVR